MDVRTIKKFAEFPEGMLIYDVQVKYNPFDKRNYYLGTGTERCGTITVYLPCEYCIPEKDYENPLDKAIRICKEKGLYQSIVEQFYKKIGEFDAMACASRDCKSRPSW